MQRGPSDPMRQHRARASIQGERDRLLSRANKADIQKLLPNDGKDRARAMLVTLGLLCSAFVGWAAMIASWFNVYHTSLTGHVILFFCLLAASGMACFSSTKRAVGKERPWLWWIGLLNMQGTIAALIFGFFIYFRFLCYYLKYAEMRTYTNVGGAQDASAFSDGSMFLFTEDTRIDPMRSVGFKSRWTGQTYCVAPIVDSTMNNANDIYYWAIGINCCATRAEFRCDDADIAGTRSALVVLEPKDVVRPFMSWAVRGDSYPFYEQAVHLQEATYFTKAARNLKLVQWTRDPAAMKLNYFSAAVGVVAWVTVGYMALMGGVCFWISWQLIPKQHREAVLRQTAAQAAAAP